jgi:hypothetical protein
LLRIRALHLSIIIRRPAARTRGNEINTARRLLKIVFAPVDWLYSESLTQKYSKKNNTVSTARLFHLKQAKKLLHGSLSSLIILSKCVTLTMMPRNKGFGKYTSGK